ncbi:hypothetical protein E2C01_078542 [Portunus trituberculatus]|uniref:Uncharacterized protein n=1 Tax=Portunus trituberculatus TaxID=210409 RepID=A0A5B7IMZ9_PORTR|nr:hypothetical protein [Portunus trituberculatus]
MSEASGTFRKIPPHRINEGITPHLFLTSNDSLLYLNTPPTPLITSPAKSHPVTPSHNTPPFHPNTATTPNQAPLLAPASSTASLHPTNPAVRFLAAH